MGKSEQNKKAALEALISSTTLTEASEKAGISRRTLYSYLKNDIEFSRAFLTMQENSSIEAMLALEAKKEKATQVIECIMNDEDQPASLRLKAAQIICEIQSKQNDRVSALAAHYIDRNTGFNFDF